MDRNNGMFIKEGEKHGSGYFHGRDSAKRTLDNDDGFYSASFNEDERYDEHYGDPTAAQLKHKKRSHPIQQESKFGLIKKHFDSDDNNYHLREEVKGGNMRGGEYLRNSNDQDNAQDGLLDNRNSNMNVLS